MPSKATTVREYLGSLPADRRAAITAVREFLLTNIDPDFEEGMSYGMIGYAVPHRIFPAGYHCDPKQPLPFAGLASQKQHMSLYLMTIYPDETDPETAWFRQAWAKAGKKIDMGKCCIRFKKLEDLAFDVLKKALQRWTVKKYVANYEAVLAGMTTKSAQKAKTAQKSTAGKATKGAAAKGEVRQSAAARTKAATPKTPAKTQQTNVVKKAAKRAARR